MKSMMRKEEEQRLDREAEEAEEAAEEAEREALEQKKDSPPTEKIDKEESSE